MIDDQAFARRAAELEWILTDVDGVLTDGRLMFGPRGQVHQSFDIKDGLGLKIAQAMGLKIGILTARKTPAAARRASDLGLDAIIQGRIDKRTAFEEMLAEHHTSAHRVAYIGDDLPDLGVLVRCGLSFAPADAVPEVRAVVHRVLDRPGGRGAVRQMVELVLRARGVWERALGTFGG